MRHPEELAWWADQAWFGRVGGAARSATVAALGLLSPTWCHGCGAQDTVFCSACAEDLHALTRSPFSAEQQALALPLVFCNEEVLVLPVTAAGHYEGLVSRAVLAFKDHGSASLATHLAPGLRRALQLALERASHRPDSAAFTADPAVEPQAAASAAAGSMLSPRGAAGCRPWLLVSAPPSLKSRLARGYDPLQLLLRRALAGSASGPFSRSRQLVYEPGLLRQSAPAALASLNPRGGRQKTRGARARRRFLAGSFQTTARGAHLLPGSDVLLVDDVLTSGSTLAELYRVLRAAGASVHGAAVLAAAPSPGGEDEFLLVSASPEA